VKASIISVLICGLLTLPARAATADEVRFVGNKVIEQGQVVTGDVVVVTGDLVVRGHVTGSAIAYVGDITLDSSAVVDGDVIARRGRIFLTPGATISGNLVEGKLPGLKVGRKEEKPLRVRESYELEDEFEPEKREKPGHYREENTDFKLAYDKVNGLYLGLDVNEFPVSDYGMRFRVFGSGGYAIASHSWQGQGGFGMGCLPRGQLEISADAYHLTATEDSWFISDHENSLAAFFLHEDFRDYYLREGAGSTIAWHPMEMLELSARYQAENHESLENATNWALFGPNKNFLPNLTAQEGMLREFVFGARLDSRDDENKPFSGWKFESSIELTNPHLASDFDYRRAVVDLRRYQPLSRFVNLDMRVRLGNSDGTLPPQKRFYLGGPSSLPGFGLKEFSGREFALWNAEIRLHDERKHHHHGLNGLFKGFGLFFFTEVGLTADRPLADFSTPDWKNDIGVGISDHEGSLRIQVAKRTDRADDAYVWMLRIERPF